jgi:hypothetical protein
MRTEAREFRAGSDLDGNVWAAFSVTSNFRMSGVLSKRWVPTDTGPLRIALTDGRGDPCGTVVYSPESGLTHGVGTYIRRFAVQVGQHILITADLNWGTGRIVHGDASLLEGLRRSG